MKASYLAFAASLLPALFGPALAFPSPQSYCGCEEAKNAAAAGDSTTLQNTIAACENSDPFYSLVQNLMSIGAARGAGSGSGSGSRFPTPVVPNSKRTIAPASGSASEGDSYERGPASKYYQPGPSYNNTLYVAILQTSTTLSTVSFNCGRYPSFSSGQV